MNKKILKIICIIIISIITISIMPTNVFGTTLSQMAPNKIESGLEVGGTTQLKNAGQDIMGIIKAVGIILSVAIVSVLGIKYMIGSSEERAGYKKSMLPYLIGAIMLFAASNLVEVVYQFATGVEQQVVNPATTDK